MWMISNCSTNHTLPEGPGRTCGDLPLPCFRVYLCQLVGKHKREVLRNLHDWRERILKSVAKLTKQYVWEKDSPFLTELLRLRASNTNAFIAALQWYDLSAGVGLAYHEIAKKIRVDALVCTHQKSQYAAPDDMDRKLLSLTPEGVARKVARDVRSIECLIAHERNDTSKQMKQVEYDDTPFICPVHRSHRYDPNHKENSCPYLKSYAKRLEHDPSLPKPTSGRLGGETYRNDL